MDNALEQLLNQPGIWRGAGRQQRTGLAHVATGFAELDVALPGGGWPLGALTEILHDRIGIGELRLLMPALAQLSRQGKWIALIAPPYIPYAPALAGCGVDLSRLLLIHPRVVTDALWAVEQALRAGTCGAVLAWPRQVDDRSLRRLQLAAEAGKTLGLLFRNEASGATASPAAVRLRLEQRAGNAVVHLLKCRGGGRATVTLDLTTTKAARTWRESLLSHAQPRPDTQRRRPPGSAAIAPRPLPQPQRPAQRPHSGRHRAAQLDLPLTPSPSCSPHAAIGGARNNDRSRP